MKIVIAGGSGFIGSALVERFVNERNSCTILTRSEGGRKKSHPAVFMEQWDGRNPGPWTGCLEGADAVVNLAGALIAGKRWSKKQKEHIRASRVDATRAIVDALAVMGRRPSVLVNVSGVGYYGNVPEGDVTETAPRGEGRSEERRVGKECRL